MYLPFQSVKDVALSILTLTDVGTGDLEVGLAATPSDGAAPLEVAITATVSGAGSGTVNYTFYCDRSDPEATVTAGWDYKVDASTDSVKQASCRYTAAGVYTPKVVVERGNTFPAEARALVQVQCPQTDPTCCAGCPVSTTTSTMITVSTTSTSTTSTTLQSGCFQDGGDGTVYDTCAHLQWEKKRLVYDVHNVYDHYSWAGCCDSDCTALANFCQPNAAAAATCLGHSDGGTVGCSTCSSGTCNVDVYNRGALTTVWDWLNLLNAGSFAGHVDWRLPSQAGSNLGADHRKELETILTSVCTGTLGCSTCSVCIDPVFGPTRPESYWTASSDAIHNSPTSAWYVNFAGVNDYNYILKGAALSVRAVRDSPGTATTTTTTTTTTSAPTTSTSTSTTSTTLQSGCFQDWGDGTIHDTCKNLQWEKKTTTPGLHDVGNLYVWSGCCGGHCPSLADYCQPDAAAATTCASHATGVVAGCGTCPNGTCIVDFYGGASTTVWAWLNQINMANFAGHNDWRLPSLDGDSHELVSIFASCGQGECIDPIFGPTASGYYWSSTTVAFLSQDGAALGVYFPVALGTSALYKYTGYYVRAVRVTSGSIDVCQIDPNDPSCSLPPP
jgi:hypothetical protein